MSRAKKTRGHKVVVRVTFSRPVTRRQAVLLARESLIGDHGEVWVGDGSITVVVRGAAPVPLIQGRKP